MMQSYIFKNCACGVWEARVEIQVSRREFHTHIHLDYVKVKFLSCIKKNYKEKCVIRKDLFLSCTHIARNIKMDTALMSR